MSAPVETELEAMRLAAISTATIQNTIGSKAERIGRNNPYWTQAYEDVCVAVDREIKHRDEAAHMRRVIGYLIGQMNNLGDKRTLPEIFEEAEAATREP